MEVVVVLLLLLLLLIKMRGYEYFRKKDKEAIGPLNQMVKKQIFFNTYEVYLSHSTIWQT